MANPMIATLPAFFNMQCTQKGDELSSDFYLYLDQTFQVMNSVITPNGIVMPSFTSAQVSEFPSNVPLGATWYNITLDKLQFQGASAVQTITSV